MNTTKSYEEFVQSLCKDPNVIKQELTAHDCHAIHMMMGLLGESGELMDAVKKYSIYRKPMDREHVVEELGDIEFYLQGLRNGLDITREEVLSYNVSKLSIRYSDGSYSNQQAIERADKDASEEHY